MVAPHLETPGHPISPPVLRLRRQFDRVAIRAARGGHRIGALSRSEQSGTGDAAPSIGAGTVDAEMSTDVHSMHPSKAVPPDRGGLRRVY